MDTHRDETRDEVYERIPWEMLEKRGGDRQWLVYVVAGAVALGVLAYSMIRNQPATHTTVAPIPSESTLAAHVTVPATTAATTAAPLVVAEADLYAIEPERLMDRVAAHAEWLAVEYVSFDGSEESLGTLQLLLPSGAPLPEGPSGTQVFVDWVSASAVEQVGPVDYVVDVLVRSLVSSGESGFTRQPPRLVVVAISLDDTGTPRAAAIPRTEPVAPAAALEMDLTEVPPEVLADLGVSESVVGGRQLQDGSWELVILDTGSDGVTRPASIRPDG
jgi:hypothetical protein